jgi:membrane protein YdbS with pleckstrin-like domain
MSEGPDQVGESEDAAESDATESAAPPASAGPRDTDPDEKPDTAAGAVDVEEETTSMRDLDARVRILWTIGAAIRAVFVAAMGAAVLFFTDLASPLLATGLFALVFVLGTIHAHLRYRAWRYEVREESLFLDRGVLTKVQTVVPYVRVQHVDTQRGPLERALGLSSLVVYTAGSRGADVTIPGLTPEEADDLQGRLKRLAIAAEGEDAV